MIEKLKLKGRNIYENTAIAKLNEVIGGINSLYLYILEHDPKEALKVIKEYSPYNKQQKWIGSLVEYKLGGDVLYGILTDIREDKTPPFVIDGTTYVEDCWLPDESIIYKGDNQ